MTTRFNARLLRAIVFGLLAAVLSTSGLYGQSSAAEISGFVTDESGAYLPTCRSRPGGLPDWGQPGHLTRAEFGAWLAGRGAKLWDHPANARKAGADPVLRAEFCKTLYDLPTERDHK